MIKVGSIPYIEKDIEDRRFAGLHKPVLLHPGRGGHRVVVQGVPEKQLPAADPDLERALKRAKRWVSRRRGTCLKRPAPYAPSSG